MEYNKFKEAVTENIKSRIRPEDIVKFSQLKNGTEVISVIPIEEKDEPHPFINFEIFYEEYLKHKNLEISDVGGKIVEIMIEIWSSAWNVVDMESVPSGEIKTGYLPS